MQDLGIASQLDKELLFSFYEIVYYQMGFQPKEASLPEIPDADHAMCSSHVAFRSTQRHLNACQMVRAGNKVHAYVGLHRRQREPVTLQSQCSTKQCAEQLFRKEFKIGTQN